MEFRINIEKKHFYILLALFLLSFIVISVYGFGTSSPPVFGHSGGEIEVSGLSGTANNLIVGRAANADFLGICSSHGVLGNFDICVNVGGQRCLVSSCADNFCDGCTNLGFYDLIIECAAGKVTGVRTVSSTAC